ncbi:hypothetical protein [Tenacibaculum sp. 1_MG-2023]|uniref:hypothetical protein n=1 Tax=Tenacibaculum sp. 1_MG-2023 TaxID=3062653 RepID=UPI0026E16E6E|nr:hypothetical protein [Tenacibaculum sp. 1_MG-2023]MDO6601045.1 hypothetical protein [Tenacibaculum sp. 1_MG-2023]
MNIYNKKTTVKELIKIYSGLRFEFSDLLKKLLEENNWDENKDTRIVSLKLMIEPIQSKIILLHLIDEHFGDISLWNLQKFQNQQQKNDFLNNRLYFIINELRESLFINIFIRFENFIKLTASSVETNGNRINQLSKDLIDRLGLNQDYKELINLFTYIRNTMHTEGFHTKPDVTISYNGAAYDFYQNKPVTFYDVDFLCEMLTEIKKLIGEIIESNDIKSKSTIGHSYENLTFEYE